MTYVFDIDGTICSKTDGDYDDAEPFKDINGNGIWDKGEQYYSIAYVNTKSLDKYKKKEFTYKLYSMNGKWTVILLQRSLVPDPYSPLHS